MDKIRISTLVVLSGILATVSFIYIEQKVLESFRSKPVLKVNDGLVIENKKPKELISGQPLTVTWRNVEKDQPCGGHSMTWAENKETNRKYLLADRRIPALTLFGDISIEYPTIYKKHDDSEGYLPNACYQLRVTLYYECSDPRSPSGVFNQNLHIAGPEFCIVSSLDKSVGES